MCGYLLYTSLKKMKINKYVIIVTYTPEIFPMQYLDTVHSNILLANHT